MNNYFETIAHLKLGGKTQREIAYSLGITEARVSQIVGSAEYASAEKKAKGWVEDTATTASLVEQVELKALRVINQALDLPDPEYALKAYAVVNKATRRGAEGTVIPGTGGEGGPTVRLEVTQALMQIFNFQAQSGPLQQLPTAVNNTVYNAASPASIPELLEAPGDGAQASLPLRRHWVFTPRKEG